MFGQGRWRTCALVALLTALASSQVATAQETSRYSLQGFGGWAYGKTDNDNFFGYSASPEGVWDNYYFALNVAARPMDKLGIRAQAFWGDDLRGERMKLDYVFAEWAQSPSLKLRVGKVLVPFGLYSETYDVGTLRPFYLLPQFYAGTMGLIPKAYLGGGITGTPRLGDSWELQYDAFGGQIEFEPFEIELVNGFDPATGLPTFGTIHAQLVGRDMLGGRLLLQSAEAGVDFGGTIIHMGELDDPEVGILDSGGGTFYNLRAQYRRGPLELRGEFFKADTDAGQGIESYYAEASYRFLRKWQVAAQYENSELQLTGEGASIPKTLQRHESIGLALNFWVSPEFVLKLNGYSVDGNMIARPENASLDAFLGRIDDSTGVLLVGAQFSF
jgi:hypothetical protein